jgi:cytochrome c biogenesis protein ResB
VNHPLSYDGVTIYQAAFQPTGRLFLTLNGRPRTVQVNAQFQGRGIAMLPIDARRVLLIFPFYVQKDPGVRENHLVAFLRQDGGFFGARPGRMPAFLRLRPGQSQQLGPVRLGFVRPEIATGLQIKKAPETAWVYSAFAIIALGTVMCLFSQRKLWLAADLSSQTLYVLYKTNKGWLGFQKELARLQQQLQQQMARGAQRG